MHGNGLKLKVTKLEPHEMIDDSAPGKTGANVHEIFALRGEAVFGKDPVADDGRRGYRGERHFGRGRENIGGR